MNILYFVIGLVVGFAIGAIIRHFELKKLAKDIEQVFEDIKHTCKNERELYRVPITFEARIDAETALGEIKAYIVDNSYISERELFGVIRIPDKYFRDKPDCEKKVWTDISSSRITVVPDGFSILLPRPEIITAV